MRRFIDLLQASLRQQTPLLVLRGFDGNTTESTLPDIDVLIKSEAIQEVDELLNSWGYHYCPEASFVKDHRGYRNSSPDGNLPQSLDVHIGDLTWNELTYLHSEQMWARLNLVDGFPKLSPEDTLIMLVCHSILGKRYFKKQYQQEISQLLRGGDIDFDYIASNFIRIFGEQWGRRVWDLIRHDDYTGLIAQRYWVLFEFIARSGKVWTFIRVVMRWIPWRIHQIVRRGALISFIGMDGAGKTQTTQAVYEALLGMGIRSRIIYTGRGRKNIIPIGILGAPYKRLEARMESRRSPGYAATAGKPSGLKIAQRILYTLAAPVFAADLFFRYWLIVLPSLWKYEVVITDRYSSDLLLMDHVPMGFKKFLYSLFPRPRLFIYLFHDIAVLHQRRPDHPLQDLERQSKLFDAILPTLGADKVKTESVDLSVSACTKLILQKVKGR